MKSYCQGAGWGCQWIANSQEETSEVRVIKWPSDQQSVCWIDIIWEMVEDKGPDQGWGLWLNWLTRVLIKTSTRKCIEVPRISNFSFVLKLFHYSISWRYEKALVVFITESLTLSDHCAWNYRTVYQHYPIAWIFNPLA